MLKRHGVLFLVIIPFLLGVVYWLSLRNNLERWCINSKGNWLSEHNECEYGGASSSFTKVGCLILGGKYYYTSPCRHYPDYPNVACPDYIQYVCKF